MPAENIKTKRKGALFRTVSKGAGLSMKGTTKVEFEVGGQTMVFESGLLAMQADGAVTCGIGDNIVFSAVTSAKEAKEGVDFFPLQVEYREKFYACLLYTSPSPRDS